MTERASLNFPAVPGLPLVDVWGASAEQVFQHHPDLTLIRCRQLLELFVSRQERQHSLPSYGSLDERLRRIHPLLDDPRPSLDKVRRWANEAVHIRSEQVRGPRSWAGRARKALLIMARAWSWEVGRSLPESAILPELPSATDELLQKSHLQLDAALQLAEARRYERSQELLDRLPIDPLRRKGVAEDDLLFLELRRDSVQQANANHRGLPSPPPDLPRSQRLLTLGRPEITDEVLHFHNRVAVGYLDQLAFDDALALLAPLEEWRDATVNFAPFETDVADPELGAVLGTKGQALAFRAHANEDLADLDAAIACFRRARTLFLDPADQERQSTYLSHAQLERFRLGHGELIEAEDLLTHAPHRDLPIDAWSPDAFRVSLALKAARLGGLDVPWAGGLAQRLHPLWKQDRPLRHPYPSIAGGLLQVHPRSAHLLRPALERTVERASPLVSWIASVHLAAFDGGAAPAPPPALRTWWEQADLERRAEEQGPLAVLPFNWA